MNVKDAVCGRTIALNDAYAMVEYRGMLYCFCSRRCWLAFVEKHTVEKSMTAR